MVCCLTAQAKAAGYDREKRRGAVQPNRKRGHRTVKIKGLEDPVPSWASGLELPSKDLLQVVDWVASWYAKRMIRSRRPTY
jgi:hypothetical protein